MNDAKLVIPADRLQCLLSSLNLFHVLNEIPQLLWGVLFGSIGFGYFVYGKRQHAVVPLVCGLALMAFPYFVSNTALIVLIGAGLSSLPYFFRI